jgi:hypothetical protein
MEQNIIVTRRWLSIEPEHHMHGHSVKNKERALQKDKFMVGV